MTQALDVVDERLSPLRGLPAASTATSSAQARASKLGIFAITFGISFALLYTVFERLNWPLFTYHPASGKLDFWKQMAGVGPPMFWYGWIVLSAGSALVVSVIATAIPAQLLRRATVFLCLLAALWPLSLEALRLFISWVSFNADYLDSAWLAAIPALAVAAAITALAPSRWLQRTWVSLLLIVPIGGLIVLGYSLKPYFTR